MAVTSDGTPYVEPGDAISAYPVVSQELAAVIDSLRTMIPIGAIFPYAGKTAPEGYLFCDGKAYTRADYYDLYIVMAEWVGQWGGFPGGNSNQFFVPDLRGRAPFGTGGTEAANTHQLGERGGDWRLQFHTHNVVYRGSTPPTLITFFGNTTTDSNPAGTTKMGVNRDAVYDPDTPDQPMNSMIAREPKITPSGTENVETNPTTSMPPFTGVNFIVWTGTTTAGKNPVPGVELPPVTTRMMIEARLEEAGIGEEEIEMLREQLAALKEEIDG